MSNYISKLYTHIEIEHKQTLEESLNVFYQILKVNQL